MSELKFSGFLEPNDDQPHHIHLNLANFLKDDDDEENKGGLTKENLETLNKINEKKKNYNNKVILNKNISLKKNNFNQLKIGRNESIAKNSEKSAKFQIKKQNFKFKTPLNNVHINESKRKIEKESDIQKNIVKKNEKFSLYLKNRS